MWPMGDESDRKCGKNVGMESKEMIETWEDLSSVNQELDPPVY